ncbi:hypothetical protein ABZ806_17780, partial [Spirillospora sp. NPDC047418]
KTTEPIKALAFNTLLSSQETDTHRAGPAFAFLASGLTRLTLPDPAGLSISAFFDNARPMSLARHLRSGGAISSDPARLSKRSLSDATARHSRRDEAASAGS